VVAFHGRLLYGASLTTLIAQRRSIWYAGQTLVRIAGRNNPFARLAMRLAAWLSLFVLAANMPSHAQAPSPDDNDLHVCAVNIVKSPPLEKQFVGYGVYLGNGTVITAAHVVGHWPSITHPHVWIAGLDLPAEVLKIGSLDDIDLALLSIDAAQLPISLQLRRNPLCKEPALVGTSVVVVYPEKTTRSRVISPLAIAPQYRAKFTSLITEAQGSGSGVFHGDRRCLLGIISLKVRKYTYRVIASHAGYAGYYVPALAIAQFIPPQFRF
jgi:hypothetical protein